MMRKGLLLVLMLALCALPTLAQDTASSSISFNGFSFVLPGEVATNVNIAQVAAEDPALEQPGGPVVKHTEFTLYNGDFQAENGYLGTGVLNVYSTADFNGYELATTEYTNLQTLLANRPDLTTLMAATDDGTNANNLPYLPVVGASQVIRAQAQYVDTAAVQGVRYLTAFRQDVSPFTGSEFRYTFQGLSGDGAYYISLEIYLNTGLFPSVIPTDYDYDALGQNYAAYMNESIATLNGATASDFTPLLAALDTLVQSFSFAGATPAPEQPVTPTPAAPEATEIAGDPLMGGLAGKTWTLVSWGSADAPQAPVEDSIITLVFSETGVGGNAGCNSYRGSFTYDNSTVAFGQMIRTLMACEEALMTQEDAYLAALATASGYTVNGDQLQLSYDGGVLTFTGA